MNFALIATYAITFLAVYVQVFLLVTFFERRKELVKMHREPLPDIKNPPTVTIIVPCWNEEKTVHGTIESVLNLDYPADKLNVIAVDDGSTDTTWQELQVYKDNPRVKIYHKENGGKHTAVNFGINQTDAAIIGCLDADSFVMPDALRRMVAMFQKDPEAMAVTPSMVIFNPKNFLQYAQRVEYNMSTYNKKMLSFLGAIHVTPGPFSLFRREVFERIGMFKKAHNTEDQEIAYRMQEHHMKIEHCHTAQVLTSSPDTVKKLYMQRLRWIYGFIQNTIDYRRMILKKEYGNFSFFTLPFGVVSIIAVVYLSLAFMYDMIIFIVHKITQYSVVGVHFSSQVNLDWFYLNTHTIVFITAALYLLLIFSIVAGTRLNKQGGGFDWHIVLYIIIYTFVAPFWLLKAVWNTVVSRRQPAWR